MLSTLKNAVCLDSVFKRNYALIINYINHGIEIMRLIVEEEKLQLVELSDQIDESTKALGPFKDKLEFIKYDDLLKKEMEKNSKKPKLTKQQKFKCYLDNWSKDQNFDLTKVRGRSRSRCSKCNQRQ